MSNVNGLSIDSDDENFDEYILSKYQKFTIAIPYYKLNTKVTDKKNIVVKVDYTCHCYSQCPRPNDYFYIQSDNITYKHIIEHLIANNFNPDCDHRFLEDIFPSKGSNVQFEIFMGS